MCSHLMAWFLVKISFCPICCFTNTLNQGNISSRYIFLMQSIMSFKEQLKFSKNSNTSSQRLLKQTKTVCHSNLKWWKLKTWKALKHLKGSSGKTFRTSQNAVKEFSKLRRSFLNKTKPLPEGVKPESDLGEMKIFQQQLEQR